MNFITSAMGTLIVAVAFFPCNDAIARTPTVIGTDERVNLCDIQDASKRAYFLSLARSICLMVPKGSGASAASITGVELQSNNDIRLRVTDLASMVKRSTGNTCASVAPNIRFQDQPCFHNEPKKALGTAVLIDRDIVLTAQHNWDPVRMSSDGTISGVAFVFGFYKSTSTRLPMKTVVLLEDPLGGDDVVDTFVDIPAATGSLRYGKQILWSSRTLAPHPAYGTQAIATQDYMLIKLDSPLDDIKHPPMALETVADESGAVWGLANPFKRPVALVGHGMGLPLMYSETDRVATSAQAGFSAMVWTDVDGYAGNSGGPLFYTVLDGEIWSLLPQRANKVVGIWNGGFTESGQFVCSDGTVRFNQYPDVPDPLYQNLAQANRFQLAKTMNTSGANPCASCDPDRCISIPSTGGSRCVPCTEDSHCKLANQTCHNYNCVLKDDPCVTGAKYCPPGHFCMTGQCHECLLSEDCPEGYTCVAEGHGIRYCRYVCNKQEKVTWSAPAKTNYNVDWGDGTVETWGNTNDLPAWITARHVYTTSGTYAVKVLLYGTARAVLQTDKTVTCNPAPTRTKTADATRF